MSIVLYVKVGIFYRLKARCLFGGDVQGLIGVFDSISLYPVVFGYPLLHLSSYLSVFPTFHLLLALHT